MTEENKGSIRMVIIGIAGIFVLLAISLAVALGRSGEAYEPEQINRIVEVQQTAAGDTEQ